MKRVRVEVRDGLAELFRGRLQDLRRFPGRERWDWEIVGFLAAFVCDPKDIQGGFITLGYAHPFRPRAEPCYGPLKRPEGVKRGLKMSKMLNGFKSLDGQISPREVESNYQHRPVLFLSRF